MSDDRPHDKLFKETFSNPELAAAEFQAVLPGSVSNLIDWSTLRVASMSTSAVASTERHHDMVFEAARSDRSEQVLVYVLFEHQSTNDPSMPLRLLEYMVRLWRSWLALEGNTLPLPPVLPVVLSHASGGWTATVTFEGLFSDDAGTAAIVDEFVPRFRYVVDDLAAVDDASLLGRELPPEAALALWVLRDGRLGPSALGRVSHFAPLLEQLAAADAGPAALGRFIMYLSVAAGDAAPDVESVAESLGKAGPAAHKAAMNNIEKFGEKFLKQGRQEGVLQGERRVLRGLLEKKFGKLSDAQRARVESLDQAAIDFAVERVLTADSVDAVLS